MSKLAVAGHGVLSVDGMGRFKGRSVTTSTTQQQRERAAIQMNAGRRNVLGPAVIIAAIAMMLFLEPPAVADDASSSTEFVVVTAPKASVAQIEKYVEDFAVASARIDKLARWQATACPITIGLTSEQNDAVSRRIFQVAEQVGARSRGHRNTCQPNIIAVVTDEGQTILDYIRLNHPRLLGRHYLAQLDRISKMTQPAQAWYDTLTQDASGHVYADSTPRGLPTTGQTMDTGFSHFDRLSSLFRTVFIVVDFNKVKGLKVGPLADYMAMLSLAQMQVSDKCQPVLTIMNLVNDCPSDLKANGLTGIDLAYLKGLYSASGQSSAYSQKRAIENAIAGPRTDQ